MPQPLSGSVHSVTLLPEEFSGAKEGTCGLFPSYYGAPLVINLGEVSIGFDNVCIMLTEESFGGRSDAKTLGESFLASHCNPSNLRSKALYVILFLFEERFGNKHRHINIFNACFLESCVENLLYILPDSVAVGANDHTTLYAGIINKVGFLNDVGIPFSKILIHRGDFGNQLFIIFCHNI